MSKVDWMNDNGVFLPMINDHVRNKFYQDAIKKYCVDKRVIDVGCGSGFLSIIAAKAGAKHVLAVEMDPNRAALATDIIKDMNLSDKITVVNANFLDVNHPADICVSETIGGTYFDEGIRLIARHAKKLGCDLIPGSVEIKAVAYEHHEIFDLSLRDGDHGQRNFNPGIDGLEDFQAIVNQRIKENHENLVMPMGQTSLWYYIKGMPYIKLRQLRSVSKTVDLADEQDIKLILPSPLDKGFFFVALFFRSIYGECTMWSQDTIFDVPIKRMNDVAGDMLISYNDANANWWITH